MNKYTNVGTLAVLATGLALLTGCSEKEQPVAEKRYGVEVADKDLQINQEILDLMDRTDDDKALVNFVRGEMEIWNALQTATVLDGYKSKKALADSLNEYRTFKGGRK